MVLAAMAVMLSTSGPRGVAVNSPVESQEPEVLPAVEMEEAAIPAAEPEVV